MHFSFEYIEKENIHRRKRCGELFLKKSLKKDIKGEEKMKRTRIFTLIMAIVWSLVGVGVIFYAFSIGFSTATFLLLLLACVAVAGNWLRYIRSR